VSGNDIRRYAACLRDRAKTYDGNERVSFRPALLANGKRCEISRGSHRTAETSTVKKGPDLKLTRRGIFIRRGKAACFLPAMIGKKRRINEPECLVNPTTGNPTRWWYIPSFPADGRWRSYLGWNDVIVFRSSSQVQIYRHFLASAGIAGAGSFRRIPWSLGLTQSILSSKSVVTREVKGIMEAKGNCTQKKKLIGWHSKSIIYYANSTSTAKKIWWFNKSLMFSCQLCYFNIENWLSVYYNCRFAESVKFSVLFFFSVYDSLSVLRVRKIDLCARTLRVRAKKS